MAVELVVLPIPPQRLSAPRFRYVEFVTLITTQPVSWVLVRSIISSPVTPHRYRIGIGWIRTNYGTSHGCNHLITLPQSIDERPDVSYRGVNPTIAFPPCFFQ